jgi:alpha-glucosidase
MPYSENPSRHTALVNRRATVRTTPSPIRRRWRGHPLLCLLLCSGALAAETLRSPDGRLALTLDLADGQPTWAVAFDGKPLLESAPLGLDGFAGALSLVGVERATRDTTWRPVWGNLSAVRDHYNELQATLRESRGTAGRKYQIFVRAYNEGIALRYIIPTQPGLDHATIKRRLTEYRFNGDPLVYHNRKYEYGTVTISTMSKSEGAVTLDAGGGRFVSLTDADRADFSQVAWERKRDASGTIVGTLNSPAEGPAPFATSWEVMIVGNTAAKLYENRHLVENVNPPCALADTSWIRAGKAISQVRNAQRVTAELKALVDFASAHKVEYLEIDHSWCGAETKWTPEEIAFFEANKSKFWNDKPEWRQNVGGNPMAPAKGWVPFRPKADSGGNFVDFDVAELAAYGRGRAFPVAICLYVRGAVLKEFGGEHPADDVFSVYERWGVAGIKLGFVPNGSQKNERAVAEVVRLAARHRLIVNIHDGYYPSGLSRTYPNLMNVEGVAGDEAEHSIAPEMKSRHDVMLPFTRCLMGPVDYTPEMFRTSKTHAHQVAMLGVFHGRPSIRGGLKQWSSGGVGGAEIEFVEKLPGLFDEMKVVTDLGKSVTVARRRGSVWYVASMADGQARSYPLPLTFLPANVPYQASIHTDTPGNLQTTHVRQTVSASSVVSIEMQPNGGHLMILEPASAGSRP